MTAKRIPALTLWRPWPSLILAGHKTVENRSWSTNYRGPLWLHAGKAWEDLDPQRLEDNGVDSRAYWEPDRHPMGIVGLVDLVSVCSDYATNPFCDCGPWAVTGEHHWRLTNPRALAEPVPCPGRQGLWWPTGELAAALAEVTP